MPLSSALNRRLTDDVLHQIAASTSASEVAATLDILGRDLGFQCFRIVYLAQERSRTLSYSNQPKAWDESVTSMPDAVTDRDPVWKHLNHSALPLVWGQSTYHQAGLADFYEEFSSYGLVSGACLSLRGVNRDLLAIGFSADQPTSQGLLRPDLFGLLYLASATILEHSLSVLGADDIHLEGGLALTARELEVLKWCREGKTAWEIGKILNVSTSTAQFHTRNVVVKLNAVNKQHAVARAIHAGLI